MFVVLLAFWLLLSGIFTPFLVAAGVGSALALVVFARRMAVVDREGHPVALWRVLFLYWPWLVKEIVKAGWEVSRLILHPKLPISPTLVRFRPSQRSVVGLVTHANSITLTPGTITIEAASGEFLVHALTRSGAAGCVGSEKDRRVTLLEEARLERPPAEVLEHWASRWYEPDRPVLEITPEDEREMQHLETKIVGSLKWLFRDGPKQADRSAALPALAYGLANQGFSASQVFSMVRNADVRWGKYSSRPNGEVYILDIVERAFRG